MQAGRRPVVGRASTDALQTVFWVTGALGLLGGLLVLATVRQAPPSTTTADRPDQTTAAATR